MSELKIRPNKEIMTLLVEIRKYYNMSLNNSELFLVAMTSFNKLKEEINIQEVLSFKYNIDESIDKIPSMIHITIMDQLLWDSAVTTIKKGLQLSKVRTTIVVQIVLTACLMELQKIGQDTKPTVKRSNPVYGSREDLIVEILEYVMRAPEVDLIKVYNSIFNSKGV